MPTSYRDVPKEEVRVSNPDAFYTQVTTLLVGMNSVEVLKDGDGVKLRIWYGSHCNKTEHTEIKTPQ